jgi:cytochrome bd-type quinol oxidase subunit 2
MAKRKRRNTKKVPAAQHTLPEGFWQQATAVVLVILGILMMLALFGTGGPMLEWVHNALRWFVGWAVFLLPVITVYIAVAIFRAENNRLPVVVILAAILFVVEIAGFVHLFTPEPLNFQAINNLNGGGRGLRGG